VELLVHPTHRLDALQALLEVLLQRRRRVPRLEAEQAGDDLEVVLHPVVHLAQQHLLLVQHRPQPRVRGLEVGGALAHPGLQHLARGRGRQRGAPALLHLLGEGQVRGLQVA
jgi:hypothetical protein